MRFILAVAALAIISCETLAQGRPAQVGVDRVITQTLSETVPVIGRVVARQQGDVASKVEGAIADVAVEVGDRVKTGAIIALVDPVRLQLARDVAQSEHDAASAMLVSSRTQIELLSQERNRMERLRNSAAFSKAAFDDKQKEIAVEQARFEAEQARVAISRAQLERRVTDLADTAIRAPYPGVVVQRFVSAGAYVRTGDPIIELINDSNLEIEADVPTERIGGLTAGLQLTVALASGQSIKARFRAVVPVENALTRTRAARFVPAPNIESDASESGVGESGVGESGVGAPDALETVGESVTIAVPLGEPREAVTVHKDAVTISRGKRTVFVIKGDKAVPQTIEIGDSAGNRFEITDRSLAPGDLVVIRGNERLRPGQEVAYDGMPDNESANDGKTGAGSAGEDAPSQAKERTPKASLGQDGAFETRGDARRSLKT